MCQLRLLERRFSISQDSQFFMKQILPAFLFLYGFLVQVYGQETPVQLWKSIEFIKNIRLKAPEIALDKFQNTYMITTQDDINPFGGYTLVKYDTTGQQLWNRNYPPWIIGHSFGSFTLDSVGNSYVSINYDGAIPEYDADVLLIKYSPDGEKLWEQNMGLSKPGDNYINRTALDGTGRLITLGVNWHESTTTENYFFIQAVDTATGSLLWEKRTEGAYLTQGMSVLDDRLEFLLTEFGANGQFYVITQIDFNGEIISQYKKPYNGYSIDFNHITPSGDILLGNRGWGYNVTKLNTQGDTLWHYHHANVLNIDRNWVHSVTEDDSSNVYATGTISLPGLSTEWVTTKFSPSGEVIWQNIFHSSTDSLGDAGNFIRVDKNRVYVAGGTQLPNTDVVGMIKIYNRFTGVEEYSLTIIQDNVFSTDQVMPFRDKIYYVSEGFQTNLFQIIIVTACAKLPVITSVVTPPVVQGMDIRVYPNPTTEWVRIESIDTRTYKEIRLQNMEGQTVYQSSTDREEMLIPVSQYPAGIYLLTLNGNGVVLTRKVVVQ